jgi:hypothetical protein
MEMDAVQLPGLELPARPPKKEVTSTIVMK